MAILLKTHQAHDDRDYRQAATAGVGVQRYGNPEYLKMAACLTYKRPSEMIFKPPAENAWT